MNYIVLDLEWNQGTKKKQASEELQFEIIEIGAVKLNERFEVVGEFGELIRPSIYRHMHHIIKEITHVSTGDLREARTFPEVADDFFAWCGEDVMCCTWGSQDLTEFQRNLDYYGMEGYLPWPLYYYDVQKLYSIMFDDGKKRKSLETAIVERKIPEDIPFHRALNDTKYTARIMRLFRWELAKDRVSIDYHRLPRTKKEEIRILYPNYFKYVSREFSDKEKAMQDRGVTETRCFYCDRVAPKRVRWFASGNRNYLCMAKCPEHGWMKGKIRMKKSEAGDVFAVKTVRPATDVEMEKVRHRKEEMRIKRQLKRHNEKKIKF